MANDKAWSIRRTPERDALVEKLRERLQNSGRTVETIHGVVTTAAVIDEALKVLETVLDADPGDEIDLKAEFREAWREAMTGEEFEDARTVVAEVRRELARDAN